MFHNPNDTTKTTFEVDVIGQRTQMFRVRAKSLDEAERIAAEVAEAGWKAHEEGFTVIKTTAVNAA